MAIYSTWQRPNRINRIIKLTQSVDTIKKIWKPCTGKFRERNKIPTLEFPWVQEKGCPEVVSQVYNPFFHYTVAFLSLRSTSFLDTSLKNEEDGRIEKVWIFFGIVPDTLLIKVDKCVINIFFFEENIFFLICRRDGHICWLMAQLPWKHRN